MHTFQTKIGEHLFVFTLHTPSSIQMFQATFPRLLPNDGGPSLPALHIDIEDGFGSPFMDYNVIKTAAPDSILFRRSDYLLEINAEYTAASVKVFNDLALKHAIMHLYSLFIVRIGWGLLIHSSCVVDRGNAHIFTGHSGAGKSTAAALSHPRELLSDEATIVKVGADEITVYDSPFRSEMQSGTEFIDSFRLASIQVLHQAPFHRRTMLTKMDAFLNLMDKVFFWSPAPEETRTIVHLLKQTVEHVPVYKLQFQKNSGFWELIS